ncbi:hypothetical protein BC939DRAFT_505572 [Gamsiella multidivaricata]|uniref:uncharacterized protein n=1 Tax=Gamsiella multidivaricata TaxID=101098 RepID=UPI00221E4B15|nr:uncharacterized protein BC939DRAFT_505572 [Gamsiella multidivaricata]KAI7819566.1 hypothetical protein BC939DRAFT_505572 [Gamsiella multidivaricata]
MKFISTLPMIALFGVAAVLAAPAAPAAPDGLTAPSGTKSDDILDAHHDAEFFKRGLHLGPRSDSDPGFEKRGLHLGVRSDSGPSFAKRSTTLGRIDRTA